jgi:sugar/nucleoside kinase (ribokinase family)
MFMGKMFPPPKILQTYDVSGAGDTFLAALISQVLSNYSIHSGIEFAQECCNKVIQRRGTCVYKKDMD